jgi:hypothetical protein
MNQCLYRFQCLSSFCLYETIAIPDNSFCSSSMITKFNLCCWLALPLPSSPLQQHHRFTAPYLIEPNLNHHGDSPEDFLLDPVKILFAITLRSKFITQSSMAEILACSIYKDEILLRPKCLELPAFLFFFWSTTRSQNQVARATSALSTPNQRRHSIDDLPHTRALSWTSVNGTLLLSRTTLQTSLSIPTVVVRTASSR